MTAATGTMRFRSVCVVTAATSVSIAWVSGQGGSSSTRRAIRGTIPSAARLAQRAPWLCAPPSRTVCPFGKQEPLVVLMIGTAAGSFTRKVDNRPSAAAILLHRRGVAQPGSARALGARGPGFESRRPDLLDRIQGYERAYRTTLPPRTWTVVRLDGRAFHTWTRGLERPFSLAMIDAMGFGMTELCKELAGAVVAYCQSDEISLVLQRLRARGHAGVLRRPGPEARLGLGLGADRALRAALPGA